METKPAAGKDNSTAPWVTRNRWWDESQAFCALQLVSSRQSYATQSEIITCFNPEGKGFRARVRPASRRDSPQEDTENTEKKVGMGSGEWGMGSRRMDVKKTGFTIQNLTIEAEPQTGGRLEAGIPGLPGPPGGSDPVNPVDPVKLPAARQLIGLHFLGTCWAVASHSILL